MKETKQERYKKNQESKGLCKVCVWVPKAPIFLREKLLKYAEKLRKQINKS